MEIFSVFFLIFVIILIFVVVVVSRFFAEMACKADTRDMKVLGKIFTGLQLDYININLKNFSLKIEGSIEGSGEQTDLIIGTTVAILEADGSFTFPGSGTLGLPVISEQLMIDVRQVFEQRGEAIPRDLEILARSFVTYVSVEAIEQAGTEPYGLIIKDKLREKRLTTKMKRLSFDYVVTFLNPFLVIMTDAEVRAGFKITYLKFYRKKVIEDSYVDILRERVEWSKF